MAKQHCDGCGKDRHDVQSVGRDSNGDADSPDLCFICRKEASRRRMWSFKEHRYVDYPAETVQIDDDLR